MRGSQGLRRPRFSFFIFTCQTARGRETPTLQCGELKLSVRRRTPTDNGRLGIHSSLWRASKTRQPAKARSQGVAALSGRVIVPPDLACQRLLSTNRRTAARRWENSKSPYFIGLFVAARPQFREVPATAQQLFSGKTNKYLPGKYRRVLCNAALTMKKRPASALWGTGWPYFRSFLLASASKSLLASLFALLTDRSNDPALTMTRPDSILAVNSWIKSRRVIG